MPHRLLPHETRASPLQSCIAFSEGTPPEVRRQFQSQPHTRRNKHGHGACCVTDVLEQHIDYNAAKSTQFRHIITLLLLLTYSLFAQKILFPFCSLRRKCVVHNAFSVELKTDAKSTAKFCDRFCKVPALLRVLISPYILCHGLFLTR